ncbi:YajG family lipoprotein [Sansalvadorimonas verongulae]|uniref:YajG family lipoprotein n=1 Tax=Sansalvadorimonas verongulae TaxID=2172824 RepID=UPI0012BB6A32|nr:YajG family lipoprotein [Sansalvadorimonas verongulae]MTI15540.1 hypothetical protein [Sansalvadorimonas verongulae]
MVRRLFSLKGLTALVFVGLLGGCALSPQNVTIAPDVRLAADTVKLDGPVTVTAFDERVTPWLGTRGGVYKESNRIGIANNLQDAVKASVEMALVEQGMTPGSSTDAPQFQVYVDTLEYKVPASNYVSRVDLKAAIRVTVRAGEQFYQGAYSATDSKRVLKAPSDDDNTQMINEILAKAIGRAFADPGLMRFMARL